MKNEILNLRYEQRDIERRVKKIHRLMLKVSENIRQPNFDVIGTKDLDLLFSLYKKEFIPEFVDDEHEIRFALSRRLTRSAGNTKYDGRVFVISLSVPLLFQTFGDVDRDVDVNGILCTDRLSAAMHVFEHEIIHVLEWIHFGNTSHNKPRFKQLALNIFGHSEITHQMVTQEERAAEVYDLAIGDEVTFEYGGKEHRGFITNITKRATVMVRDKEGMYRDDQGKRYTKYYIPLSYLKPGKKR